MDISFGKTIEPRATEEIEALKANRRNDPIWDIEDTEGFELHRDELVAYRLEWEARWKSQRVQRLLKFATPLGLQNNLVLAEFLMRQDAAIEELKTTVQHLGLIHLSPFSFQKRQSCSEMALSSSHLQT